MSIPKTTLDALNFALRTISGGSTPPCPWTTPDECAMAREREAAGRYDTIPDCPVHGAYPPDPNNVEGT
jgi:hypothetical protein